VDHSSLVEAVETEGTALGAALAAGPLSAPVPTCEGWTVADLAVHVGDVCGFWSHVLCEGTGEPKTPFPDPPEGEALAPWFADLHRHLVERLAATPADTEVWTWFRNDHSAGFVARRCAHELAVHRVDAQSARGAASPIAAELAVDGIDEIMGALLETRDRSGRGTARRLELRPTDADVEWTITIRSDHIDVARRSSAEEQEDDPGARLSGSASDIELLLYHRPPLGPTETNGDASLLEEWYREFTF
jgi:uncharacterized protein (TIGR03083 family)